MKALKIANNFTKKFYLEIIFLIAFLSVFGSLYFSDIVGIEPCSLCWWQRIFMYPIFIISTVSLVCKIKIRKAFIFGLSIPGMLFAIYHYLMQTFGLFKEISACTGASKPCDVVDIALFGFITIPLLSLVSFLIINILLLNSFGAKEIKQFIKKLKTK